MANMVYIATSLDGFIADRNGGLDWLTSVPNPEGSDFGFGDFMNRVDALVMGRKTFDTVVSFDGWPYSKPVFVLGRSLPLIPESLAGKAEGIIGGPREVVDMLRAKGYRNLYIDGGQTIQSFLREDLVDELVITRVPVLLGGGIPLFGHLDAHLDFEHVGEEDLGNGLVKSRYLRPGREQL